MQAIEYPLAAQVDATNDRPQPIQLITIPVHQDFPSFLCTGLILVRCQMQPEGSRCYRSTALGNALLRCCIRRHAGLRRGRRCRLHGLCVLSSLRDTCDHAQRLWTGGRLAVALHHRHLVWLLCLHHNLALGGHSGSFRHHGRLPGPAIALQAPNDRWTTCTVAGDQRHVIPNLWRIQEGNLIRRFATTANAIDRKSAGGNHRRFQSAGDALPIIFPGIGRHIRINGGSKRDFSAGLQGEHRPLHIRNKTLSIATVRTGPFQGRQQGIGICDLAFTAR